MIWSNVGWRPSTGWLNCGINQDLGPLNIDNYVESVSHRANKKVCSLMRMRVATMFMILRNAKPVAEDTVLCDARKSRLNSDLCWEGSLWADHYHKLGYCETCQMQSALWAWDKKVTPYDFVPNHLMCRSWGKSTRTILSLWVLQRFKIEINESNRTLSYLPSTSWQLFTQSWLEQPLSVPRPDGCNMMGRRIGLVQDLSRSP